MSHVTCIGVIGAGAMGRGIAEVAGAAGIPTVLVKATPGGALDDVHKLIAGSYERAVRRGHLDGAARDAALDHIQVTSDLDAASRCDFVIESVIEELDVKQRLLADAERFVRDDAVIATNTSSLPVSRVGERLRHPARLLGMHFFSPVAAMKLVELAPTTRTAPFAVERAQALTSALGKIPVIVGESSGYIVNRLLVPYLLDAISSLDEGLAGVEAIDTAMKLGCGHPMGPLALADAIGLDIVYAMARSLYHYHHDRRFSPPALLRRLVGMNQLGKKTGAGFYDYSSKQPRENPALRALPIEAEAAEHLM